MTNKPTDLEQRISERRDVPGGDSEIAKLIAADRDAAALDETYSKLNHMLAGWRRLPEGVDFGSFRAIVADAVAVDVEYRAVQAHDDGETPDVAGLSADAASRLGRDYKKTDDAIRATAARPMPAVDWNALKSRISAAVRTEAAESDPHHERTILLPAGTATKAVPGRRAGRTAAASKRYLWKTLAMPMSAAAAIAIAATAWFNRGAPVAPTPAPVNMHRIVVQLAAPQHSGMVNIAFDESPMPAALAEEPSPRGAAIAIGPGFDDLTPLSDDALWQ